MKKKYIILDVENNRYYSYIDLSLEFSKNLENAHKFDTEQEAEKFMDENFNELDSYYQLVGVYHKHSQIFN